MGASDLSQVDRSLSFRDDTLLTRALTHRSYLNEHPESGNEDNERLEFLGDAVLDFLVGELVFERFPELSEGDLTNLRAALVRRETLSRLALRLDLGHFLRMGRGEEESGGRDRPALLCAAFEAVVGALYLDQGLGKVREFLLPLIEPELRMAQREALTKDAKSRLQEWSQKVLQTTPKYRTVAVVGPDHAKEFTVEVCVANQPQGTGVGPSKQAAAQAAAAEALARLTAAHPLNGPDLEQGELQPN